MMWKECLQCDGGERSPAAGATVWLRFGYTHPGGNKEKLKGGDLRNYERGNMLDFGIGVGVEISGPIGCQWAWRPLSNLFFFYDLKESMNRELG